MTLRNFIEIIGSAPEEVLDSPLLIEQESSGYLTEVNRAKVEESGNRACLVLK